MNNVTNTSNKYFAFDKSIHNTLAEFNKIYAEKDRTLKKLLELLDKNWVSDGYLSPKEENKFKLRGFTMLTNYFANPLDVGQDTFIINKILRKKVSKNLVLTAKLDKVYERTDGDFEIIDYKTGRVINHTENFNLNIRSVTYMLLIEQKLGIFPKFLSYYYLSYNKKFTHVITKTDIENLPIFINDFIAKQSIENRFYREILNKL
ncbi:PD-(D/E)XK nuclease family protein [Clostridium ganghwense]|uniref:PD-(D/E)XK nuclease family protein n=1 Tax=Clostridium ganghwense TaxID=312089 RepID=A0ABT4CNX9_9CLOT|nr:PD-(D/E)XK nuclease family protein [Clostridium ganghwense]MCY6370653.1 PD-(D/E)XK nuclease family protein [Clostridium ganghwense]